MRSTLILFTIVQLLTQAAIAQTTTQSAQTLEDLLAEVKAIARQESTQNKQRENEFLNQKNRQQELLNEARRELKKAQTQSDKLKSQFNSNEKKLAELEKDLHLRMGSLGELFGVVKQVAGDTRGVIDNSLVSAQISDRQTFLANLAQQKAIPGIQELEQLWFVIQQETVESGKVVRFPARVTLNDGTSKDSHVTRAGAFNAVSDGKIVRYIPETRQIMELPRQPASDFVDAAAALENSSSGLVDTMIDPSRGAILSMLIQVPGIVERVQQGKLIAYIILALAIAGLLIALQRFIMLTLAENKIKAQLKNEHPDSGNALGRIIGVYRKHPKVNVETLERKLDEAIIRELPSLERGISVIKVLAVIAPLLGLLGTVTGMIETFQSITLFGTGDPKLMAGGISQALVTTVLGLTAAIPLIFLHSLVNTRSKRCINILEEQSAGLVAAHAETANA